MSSQSIFDKKYKELNEKQRKAVDSIEGPVMVIAGPGTGKTTILTLRIANILRKTDTSPENILALTFTESGVYAMRKKLVEMLGNVGYRIRIYTFHSFANEIIKIYPEYFPRIIGGVPITETEHIKAIESILDEGNLKELTPYGDNYYYVNSIISAIRDLKREGFNLENYDSFISSQEKEFENNEEYYNKKTGKLKTNFTSKKNKLLRSRELLKVYEEYQKYLFKNKQYDFEDMILELVSALQSEEELLLTLQEEYQYILADEHQDSNNAQNKILELLANFHDSPNLFIVGDEKQAIYRFQGASLENFLYFKGKYKDAQLISLDTNYRSSQTILDSSHEMIANNIVDDPILRIRLKANEKKEGKSIKVCEFSDEIFEQQFIVSKIEDQIKNGTDPSNIAVLYRNNRDFYDLLKYLEQTEIPFTIHADRNLLQEKDAERLQILLQTAADPLNSEALAKTMHLSFINLSTIDVHKILQEARKKDLPIIDIITNDKELKEAGVKNLKDFKNFSEKIINWSKVAHDISPSILLEKIFRESGLIEDIFKKESSYERLYIVDSFFKQIETLLQGGTVKNIEDVLNHLKTLEEYNIRVSIKTGSERGISLMTAHRSKGLEFEHVYIIGATDKRWGGKLSRSYFILPLDDIGDTVRDADERRLFYVAITRAKESVTITYSKVSADGREFLPSIFISELKKELISFEDTKLIEKDLEGLKKKYKNIEVKHNSAHDIEYLQERFLNQPFSVTALNNYLECPWKYFFVNLVRIPKVYTKFQKYGTAVHQALDSFFNKYQKGENPDQKYLIDQFKQFLPKNLLSKKEYKELLNKGEIALKGYFKTYNSTWPRQIRNEFSISGVDFLFNDQKLVLTGKLDKVEFENDEMVNVIDYKTAKPKSRNHILGKTKEADGAYFRQLVFYKILLDRFDDGRLKMQNGIIEFIEPDEKGKFKKEIFEITEQDTKELEELIEKSVSEIYSLSFWDKRCNDEKCEFCRLRELMD